MTGLHITGLLAVLILFTTAFLLLLINNPKHVFILSLSTMVGTLILMLLTVADVFSGGPYTATIGHYDAPLGITFGIGQIESIIGLCFSVISILVVWFAIYRIGYEIKETRINLYFALLHLVLASLLGIIFTADIFNSFVFIEVSTLSACGLIVIKDKPENIKATIKYLILSSLGSGLMLMGIAYLYSITGHLNMLAIHNVLQENVKGHENIILVSVTMFTIGLGIKSAMFPLHIWLPDAHSSAPGPSSAVLSGIVIKSPALLLFKILFTVYGIEILRVTAILPLILFFGAAGMIFGSVLAWVQKDLKRMVAYSSVAQMGYIFFGFGLGSAAGIAIAVYHMVAHGLTKSCIFLTASSFIEQTGSREISKLKGIGKKMPVTTGIFTLNAFSMAGIPILPGFISKWNLALATIEQGKFYLLLIIIASSLLNISYYFPIIINGYFGNTNLQSNIEKSGEKPIRELMPLIILTVIMIAVGIGSAPIIEWISGSITIS